MQLRPGQALVSAVDTTQVVVTRAPDGDVELTCGGVPMVPKGTEPGRGDADPAHLGGSLLGKRYVNAAGTLEVLCTKAGEAALALSGELLGTAVAKPLPASD